MTRRPKPLLPTTTALSNKHETEIRSNILVSLTFLQPTGWSMEHSVGGVKFTVIEVEPFAG